MDEIWIYLRMVALNLCCENLTLRWFTRRLPIIFQSYSETVFMEAPRGFLTALIGKLPFVIHLLIPNEGCCSKGLFSFKVLKAECTCLLRNGILKKVCFLCGHTIPLSCASSQFSSVAQLCLTLRDPWTAARQASLSITNSRNLLKLMSIESVIPSNHLIFCCPLLLPPSIFPSIRVFSNESVLHIRWP